MTIKDTKLKPPNDGDKSRVGRLANNINEKTSSQSYARRIKRVRNCWILDIFLRFSQEVLLV